MRAVLMCALPPHPLTRACGQPEPSAWRALLAANQAELIFVMASCWFARESMAAVHRLLRSGFCRMEGEVRVAGASACVLVELARVNSRH